MILLGVNIDHIATLRNARGTKYPSLAAAAGIAEQNGADFITIHLREDRRHIREEDLYILKDIVETYINLEMACNEDVLKHALKSKPFKATLVPERREELTTEGGLNIRDNLKKITEYTEALKKNGTVVSLFIEADIKQLENYLKTGADEIEIHTGKYSDSTAFEQQKLLKEFSVFSAKAKESGLRVCAGHGLNYHNTQGICLIKEIEELNIGHSIIARSMFIGLAGAVREMKDLIKETESLLK